jgi:Flp pilus assembly pilin Flp
MKNKQRAQGIAEYALILGFIVMIAMGSIILFGEQIGSWWSTITANAQKVSIPTFR